LTESLAKRVVALVPVAASATVVSDTEALNPITSERARELALNLLNSLLALKPFDDLLEECVNLILCIATSL